MKRRDFYDDATYEEILERIDRLNADTAARWGRMSAAQMCAHCAEIAEVAAGKPLAGTPWIARLLSGMIRRMVVAEKPYPRSLRTHPQYLVTDERDFDEERTRLREILRRMKDAGPQGGAEHPLFGEMSAEETGWVAYKHLDHHLRQFGL